MCNKKYRVLFALLILVLSVQLCGFSFGASIAIDTKKNPIYSYVTADKLTAEFSKDNKLTKYKNQYIVLSGLFESSNNKSFTITNSNYESIACKYKKNSGVDISGFDFKENVAVWGKCTVSFGKIKITDVRKVTKAPAVRSAETFFTLDGTFLDKSDSLERTLNGGRIKYYIPSSWETIEKNIVENEIGEIDGYQYVLNKIPGCENEVPESLFVCYFNKDRLAHHDDIKKTNKVEKAIIENIEGSVGIFPTTIQTTYYNAKYQHYCGIYTDQIDNYSTEYVFQTDGDRGIIMYLYLYRESDAKHLSDVMLITRLLETVQ